MMFSSLTFLVFLMVTFELYRFVCGRDNCNYVLMKVGHQNTAKSVLKAFEGRAGILDEGRPALFYSLWMTTHGRSLYARVIGLFSGRRMLCT